MIRLGILTVRQEKNGFWAKLRQPIRIKERFQTQVECIVAELAWTEAEIMRFPRWIRMWFFQRAKCFLIKQGCQGVAPEQNTEAAFFLSASEITGFYQPISMQVLKSCLMDLVPKCCESIYVKADNLKGSEDMIAFLCPTCKELILCTKNKPYANAVAEKICNNYGFYPEIQERDLSVPRCGFWLDMDKCAFGMGEMIIVDSMEVQLDLHGYRVAQGSYWSGVPLPNTGLSFVSWCKGKKRLTID